ncbi:MAG TPA: Fur family transcriptional regulator [Candidatus Paceibacterota bacterium]|jgi:Fur family ferric uptake transcriptional regulator|nr:Fur family transcriptional regulator [Candidatus Paceibacterota bacterium]
MKDATIDLTAALKAAGFKATPGRLQLLEVLSRVDEPLSVLKIQKRLGKKLNEVTLYRALEAFAKAGLVRRVDLGHDHAHYELALGRAHHDHVVCTACGAVEDVAGCPLAPFQKKALKSSHFKSIYSHNLEFFGLCRACSK